MKPPKMAALRPKFGIGVVIGALVLLATQASGSDPALGLVLGTGAGIALGLTMRNASAQRLMHEAASELPRDEQEAEE